MFILPQSSPSLTLCYYKRYTAQQVFRAESLASCEKHNFAAFTCHGSVAYISSMAIYRPIGYTEHLLECVHTLKSTNLPMHAHTPRPVTLYRLANRLTDAELALIHRKLIACRYSMQVDSSRQTHRHSKCQASDPRDATNGHSGASLQGAPHALSCAPIGLKAAFVEVYILINAKFQDKWRNWP